MEKPTITKQGWRLSIDGESDGTRTELLQKAAKLKEEPEEGEDSFPASDSPSGNQFTT